MSAPDETESTTQSAVDAPTDDQGVEPIDMLAQLRLQPSPATSFQLLKDAVRGYSPVAILSQLTVRFLFVRRDEFHEESSEIHRHHAYIEFLTGFLVSQQFPAGESKYPTVPASTQVFA